MDNNEYTFWSFLENYGIEIPIIQRDYAQGRLGEEAVRRNFLQSLRGALEYKKELLLDFVYGSIENERLLPLDGQQRLTTLWLLHWYIAYKAEKISEAKGILRKFSYETRISSREFCKKLSEFDKKPQHNERRGIKNHIMSQTWFHSSWEQDPTISAMLTMLGGTGKDDGIEKVFKEEVFKFESEKYGDLWELLTNKYCPIKFFHQSLENFGLADDLYIKMNARGKPLTSFENLKADLVGYIKNKKDRAEKDANEWAKLLNPENHDIPNKLDNGWTDIFWKNRSSENKIDDIYFTFINRFFLNYKIKDVNEDDKYYKYFEKDTSIKYESFDNYKWEAEIEIERELLIELSKVLNNYAKYEESLGDRMTEVLSCPWGISFEFIPTYSKDCKVSSFGMIQRVVFYAVCKYFNEEKEEEDSDETSLRRWMRFVWNLVSVKVVDVDMKEGDYIIDLPKVKETIKLIDEVSDSHDVYQILKDIKSQEKGERALYKQLKEEEEKARAICDKVMCEDRIKEAEKHAFFQGSIGFLFRNENGEWDWDNFDQKLEKIDELFDKEGLKDEVDNKAEPLKILISWFSEDNADWYKGEIALRGDRKDHLGKPMFNNNSKTWRYLLNNTAICKPVHKLLMGESLNKDVEEGEECSNQRVLWMLSQTKLLDYVVKYKPTLHYRKSHIYQALFDANFRILMGQEGTSMAELVRGFFNGKEKIDALFNEKGKLLKGLFICQKKNAKQKDNGGWEDAKILEASENVGEPEVKTLEDYYKEHIKNRNHVNAE